MTLDWLSDNLQFCEDDLSLYGVGAYDSVVVLWDSDMDERVYTVIRDVHDSGDGVLVAIAECQANVRMVWDSIVPAQYSTGSEITVKMDRGVSDVWFIDKSIIAPARTAIEDTAR